MNKNLIFFKEAAAKMKVSKETSEKLARIRERIKGMGDRTSPFRKTMKEE
jgi:hypothetical protein